MMSKLRRGPSDPMPQSGHNHGPTNRRKLEKHVHGSIVLLDHAIRHAKRALERTKAEYHDGDEIRSAIRYARKSIRRLECDRAERRRIK